MPELLLGRSEPQTGIKFWTERPHCAYGANRRHHQSGPCQVPAEVEPRVNFYYRREDIEHHPPGSGVKGINAFLEVRLPFCKQHARGIRPLDLITEGEIREFFEWCEATGKDVPITDGMFVSWGPFDINKGANVRTMQQYADAHERAKARGEA